MTHELKSQRIGGVTSNASSADLSVARNQTSSLNLHFVILFCCVGSDEEDDTAELLAELERIKKERAEEKLRKVPHYTSSLCVWRFLCFFCICLMSFVQSSVIRL